MYWHEVEEDVKARLLIWKKELIGESWSEMGFQKNIKNETLDKIKITIQEYIYQKYGASVDVTVYYSNSWTSIDQNNLTIIIEPVELKSAHFTGFRLNRLINPDHLDTMYENLTAYITKEIDPILIKAFANIIKDKNIQFVNSANSLTDTVAEKAQQTFINHFRSLKELGLEHDSALGLANSIHKAIIDNSEVKVVKW